MADFYYFSLSEINKGDYSLALIRDSLITRADSGYELDKWRHEYGSSRVINSGYRNPVRNDDVGGKPLSRHMFGDAADLDVVSNTVEEWDDLKAAADLSDSDFVEPQTGACSLGCVHADWRDHPGDYQ